MDDLREERDELEALERDADGERREQEDARRFWTDDDGLEWWQHVGAETERWSR